MSNSSKRWLKEHETDQYVKNARKRGYPSRAAYKLIELQQKYHLMKTGMTVIDLGAAPGGWSMVAKECVGERGGVIAVDLLPMSPITGVDFIQGDFNDPIIVEKLLNVVKKISKNAQVDLVISDMAPNISGIRAVDQARSQHLVEIAWDCCQQLLNPQGIFVAKIFQGAGVDALILDLRKSFKHVRLRKPSASRSRSSEVYLLATGFYRL